MHWKPLLFLSLNWVSSKFTTIEIPAKRRDPKRSTSLKCIFNVLMLRPFFPELVVSTDLLSFDHLSVLLFCFKLIFYICETYLPYPVTTSFHLVDIKHFRKTLNLQHYFFCAFCILKSSFVKHILPSWSVIHLVLERSTRLDGYTKWYERYTISTPDC